MNGIGGGSIGLGLRGTGASVGNHCPGRIELHDILAGNRLDRVALVAEGNFPADQEGAGFEKWILHACDLALHGFQRFADDRRAHTFGAQISYLLYLQQVRERKLLDNSEPGLPSASPLTGGL